jgi:hypothetical protein
LALTATGAELLVPGAGIVARLIEHVGEMRDDARRAKTRGFCLRLLHGLETPEDGEKLVRELSAVPEFAELASAMDADFEREKAEVYALAALRIAHGDVPPEARRDLVHTLQQLRIEDLVFLFEVLVNEATKTVHEIRKIESVRHPGILQRLLNTGCLEQKRGDSAPKVSTFGKQVLDWIRSELPLPPPHEAHGRRGREARIEAALGREAARALDPYDASGKVDPYAPTGIDPYEAPLRRTRADERE